MAKLSDTPSPKFALPDVTTDAGKNQRAANRLHVLYKKHIRQSRGCIRNAAKIIDEAPGQRDAIISLFDTSEQVEMTAFLAKLKAVGNDLRETNTQSLSESVMTEQTGHQSKLAAQA